MIHSQAETTKDSTQKGSFAFWALPDSFAFEDEKDVATAIAQLVVRHTVDRLFYPCARQETDKTPSTLHKDYRKSLEVSMSNNLGLELESDGFHVIMETTDKCQTKITSSAHIPIWSSDPITIIMARIKTDVGRCQRPCGISVSQWSTASKIVTSRLRAAVKQRFDELSRSRCPSGKCTWTIVTCADDTRLSVLWGTDAEWDHPTFRQNPPQAVEGRMLCLSSAQPAHHMLTDHGPSLVFSNAEKSLIFSGLAPADDAGSG